MKVSILVDNYPGNKTSAEHGLSDFIPDDSAVALLTAKGLFVITGCGHAGVVNTLEHAKEATGERRIQPSAWHCGQSMQESAFTSPSS